MSGKKVPVYVGEGIDRVEVGRAGVETLADGTTVVNISIENPDWGGWTIGGFFPLRLTGIIPINHLERRPVMPAAEDRQAKALEQIAQHNKEMAKIFAKMNENLVVMFSYIKKQIEQDNAAAEAYAPDQMSLDEIRAKAEKLHEHEEARRRTGEEVFTTHDDQLQYDKDAKDRAERREYEERTGETWKDEGDDPIQDKVDRFHRERSQQARMGEPWTQEDIDRNRVEHLSEFNNPEHRPITFQKPGEGPE